MADQVSPTLRQLIDPVLGERFKSLPEVGWRSGAVPQQSEGGRYLVVIKTVLNRGLG